MDEVIGFYMRNAVIALFGEAEKGEFRIPYLCRSLPELAEHFGHPPAHSQGLFFAVQALLYHYELIFLRVKEEGFSIQDYLVGVKVLEKENIVSKVAAICLPGVGEQKIIEAVTPICTLHHNILIINELDLYDYLTY